MLFPRPPETSSWLPRPRGPCHLRMFDRYTFTVGVNMMDVASQNSEVVQLTVTHRFYHTMVTLREKTQVTVNPAYNSCFRNFKPYTKIFSMLNNSLVTVKSHFSLILC